MVDGLSPTHWSQLRVLRPQSEDALAVIPVTVDGNETGLSSAMDQAGLLHLLIPVTKGPDGALPADLNGLKVRHRRLETGDILDLSAPPSHEQVFTPFCNEIVDAVVRQSREPWRAVAVFNSCEPYQEALTGINGTNTPRNSLCRLRALLASKATRP